MNAEDFIKQWEGCRLNRYLDVSGNPTIGIGHKILPDEQIGVMITQEQCDQLFQEDYANAQNEVQRLVSVPLTDNAAIALVDFVFNLGSGALARSTLLKYINSGDMIGAAGEFNKWVYAGGQVNRGLVNRRRAEAALFLTPDD